MNSARSERFPGLRRIQMVCSAPTAPILLGQKRAHRKNASRSVLLGCRGRRGKFPFAFIRKSQTRSRRAALDMAETSNYFNFAPLDAPPIRFAVGTRNGRAHNRKLIISCSNVCRKTLRPTSPLDSAQRGPYVVLPRARRKNASSIKTREGKVIHPVCARNIRVSRMFINTERDIDRLISAITL